MKKSHSLVILLILIIKVYSQDTLYEIIRDESGLLRKIQYIKLTKNSSFKIKEIDFYENGNKAISKNFNNFGEVEEVLEWYENGQKKLENFFFNGTKNGLWKVWYENGNIKSEINYLSDLSNGSVMIWNEKGQINYHGNFIADTIENISKENGWVTEWFDNGQKKSEQHYKDGQLDGFSYKWYKNGQRLETGKFYNGSGIVYRWDVHGKKINERTYENGIETKD